jgi:putative heme-binding domain-containing protein
MNYDDPAIGKVVLRQYQTTLPDEQGVRSTAQRLLASRKAWTLAFLDDIEASSIDQTSIALSVVEQMRLQNDPEINRRVEKLWGRTRPSPAEAQQQVERYRSLLQSGSGDLARGKAVFKESCATCHKLYGEGGDTGPELTGYERTNLEFMLPSIVDPSAAIREEFTNFAVFTVDGRTLTGLIQDQNNRTVTLRSVDNQTTLVNRDKIEELKALPVSLMPDGLLTKLSDEQVRDLFAYLMSRAPDQK